MGATRKVLKFLLSREKDPTDFRNQTVPRDWRGRPRGTYEQMTGEKPPRVRGEFGQTPARGEDLKHRARRQVREARRSGRRL